MVPTPAFAQKRIKESMKRESTPSLKGNGSGLFEEGNLGNVDITKNSVKDEIKLDYGNVLLVPGTQTTVTSRKLVKSELPDQFWAC